MVAELGAFPTPIQRRRAWANTRGLPITLHYLCELVIEVTVEFTILVFGKLLFAVTIGTDLVHRCQVGLDGVGDALDE